MSARSRLLAFICLAFLSALACRTAEGWLGLGDEPVTADSSPPTASVPASPPEVSTTDDLRIETFAPRDSEMTVRFTLQPGEVSFLFTATATDPNSEVAILRVTAPDGTLLYEDDYDSDLPGGGWFTDFVYDYGEVGLFLPIVPQMPLPPGEYAVLVSTEAAGFSDLRVIFKRGPADAPQALDFTIWLATGELGVITAPDLDEIRGEMDALLAPHDLRVGAFNVQEPDTSVVAQFAEIDDDETHLDELDIPAACGVMARAGGASRSVHLIVVDWITASDAEPGDIVGYSAGLPGSILNPGGRLSCIVASYQAYLGSNLEHGLTWIHEAAHFMGLLHTTEEDGLYFDNLADTPQCPADRFDGDGDGYVDDYECGREGGADNFLFYSGILEFAPFTITPDQAWVLRRHPLFYPVAP
ncbi:MAG: hypothetical protein EPO32_07515 [Anaerolineae bacterium]|nr:MAG: hypothetical protein EPO32_07515 [Anaerolineae bacterium]